MMAHIRLSDYAVLAEVFGFKDAETAKAFFERQQAKCNQKQCGKLVNSH